jgi:hypothetical protein
MMAQPYNALMRTILLAALLLLGACAEPTINDGPAPPPDQVTGLITQIEFEGDRLTNFVIEARGATYDILIDPERDYGFNLKHLEVHRADELPVLVELESRGGDLYAVSILDA